MKKIFVLAAVLALAGGVAYANFCARDYVPAATLLVPYAVVDLDASGAPTDNGYTTLLGITNVSSTRQLIHVTVWDAQSNHVIDFDEVLSGYDVWTINFRDMLRGNFGLFDTGDSTKPAKDDGSGPKPPGMPQIGDFWAGPTGTAAVPYGPTSNTYTTALPAPQDVDFTSLNSLGCNFPYGDLSSYSSTIISLLQSAIQPLDQDASACKTGSVTSPPYLANLTANPVFFYVTVDDVSACNQNFPDDVAYWTPTVFPTYNNVLIGDVTYLNASANFSESVPAVSIEASNAWASATHKGFYSRYSTANGVNDFHEPLATAFGFRYLNSGGITSNVMVWKNEDELLYNKSGVATTALACTPYVYYAFDENENSKARGGGGPSGFTTAEPNVIPYETQKVPLTVANWNGLMANNGWMMLVFDPSVSSRSTSNVQAWVGVQYYFGTYSTALEAATLGNVWCFTNDVLPSLNTYNGSTATVLNAAPTAP